MTFEDVEKARGKWTELNLTVLNIANAKTQKILVKDENGRNEWIKQHGTDPVGWIDNDDLCKTIPFRVRWSYNGMTGYSLKPKVLGETQCQT